MQGVQAGQDVLQHRAEPEDVGVPGVQPAAEARGVHPEATPEPESRPQHTGKIHQGDKPARRGATITKACEHAPCSKQFTTRVADHKRGWGRYCSKSCKALAQAERSNTGNDPEEIPE